MWDRPVVGFKIGKEDIEYWNNGMMHGVKDEAGNVVGKISNTICGIYLRSCRAVWNECVSLGYPIFSIIIICLNEIDVVYLYKYKRKNKWKTIIMHSWNE